MSLTPRLRRDRAIEHRRRGGSTSGCQPTEGGGDGARDGGGKGEGRIEDESDRKCNPIPSKRIIISSKTEGDEKRCPWQAAGLDWSQTNCQRWLVEEVRFSVKIISEQPPKARWKPEAEMIACAITRWDPCQ